jgi:hypothetical protein
MQSKNNEEKKIRLRPMGVAKFIYKWALFDAYILNCKFDKEVHVM